MASRNRYSIIKGIPADEVHEAIRRAVQKFPGKAPWHSKWADFRYQVQTTEFVALQCADALVLTSHDDAWPLAEEIGLHAAGPHMELRVQESDHWDFTLYRAGEMLADFSTRVGYFDADVTKPRPWKFGGPDVLAKYWGLPLHAITPYLIDWDTLSEPQFVTPEDQHPANEWYQVFDFMRVLGIAPPERDSDSFNVSVPMWRNVSRRQPFWRRVIRNVSIRIKGTYPDVPRRTPEEQAEIDKRHIWIEKITFD